jgi:hypothetical protein
VRERETTMAKDLEEQKQEQAKWKAKVKEQTERYKDVFTSLERMKKQAELDAATIKRLQVDTHTRTHTHTRFAANTC